MSSLMSRCAKWILVALVTSYLAIPLIIRLFPWIQTSIIFLNKVRWPPFIDLKNPGDFGLVGGRNFYLNVTDEVTIGVWHILPISISSANDVQKYSSIEDTLKEGMPIIIYLHGNTGTRAGWHRVQLYKILSKLDFHVFAIDYRGYADSTGSPTEDGVCDDGIAIYKWVRQHSPMSSIIIWGHSLGTGITTKLSKKLCEEGNPPDAVILEAPFTNILDAASSHPLALPYKYMPGFQWIFVDTIKENGIQFASDQSIAYVTPPLLIMHAEDDAIVSFELGKKLYQKAAETRSSTSSTVQFVSFNASYGYGHKHMFRAPEFPDIVRKFVSSVQKI